MGGRSCVVSGNDISGDWVENGCCRRVVEDGWKLGTDVIVVLVVDSLLSTL